jgi:hypothetical protein
MIEDIENPIDRFVAFIEERENIRVRRESGKPWPWTNDDILQSYRFTNIHREDDAVSKHYQKIVRDRYGDNPLVLPATVLYRWFNRPSTCDVLFDGPFEKYIETGDMDKLVEWLEEMPPPHVTGSFIIQGKAGYPKYEGVLHYFHGWCQRSWELRWNIWKQNPPLLVEMFEWLNGEGLGSFMRAQLVADLKYIPFMLNVSDWWYWAAPGPGSLRGLNIVSGRGMMEPWPKGEWLIHLMRLGDIVTPKLEDIGIGRLHNQDLQNCLCEFGKYTKVARGIGRPRQVFHHV